MIFHKPLQLLLPLIFLVGMGVVGGWGMHQALGFAGPFAMTAVGIGLVVMLYYGLFRLLPWIIGRMFHKRTPRELVRYECPSKPGLPSIN